MSTTEKWPQYLRDIQYSEISRLNTLEICFPRPTTTDRNQLWVIYIHGGAWMDPEIDASSFQKTQGLVLQSPESEHIAALASINYRLSSYPSHPRDPSNPSDPARNARHSDHINDVLAALLHLQETFAFKDRYILVGHSCGATLALQVAMKRRWSSEGSWLSSSKLIAPPMAILAAEGLLDLPALVKYHSSEPVYRDFVTNAFGLDESIWKAASPTKADYATAWPGGRLVVIAHSHEDELVEWEQADLLFKALKAQGWDETQGDRRLKLLELRGKHDEVWEEGSELARAIVATLQLAAEIS